MINNEHFLADINMAPTDVVSNRCNICEEEYYLLIGEEDSGLCPFCEDSYTIDLLFHPRDLLPQQGE